MPNADGSATEAEAHEAQIDALERAVAGAEHRVSELEAMPAAHPEQLEAAKADAKLAKENLATAIKLQPARAKKARPRKAKESR